MKLTTFILSLSIIGSSLLAKEFQLQNSDYYFSYDQTKWEQLDLGADTDDLWGFTDRLLYLDAGLMALDYLDDVESVLDFMKEVLSDEKEDVVFSEVHFETEKFLVHKMRWKENDKEMEMWFRLLEGKTLSALVYTQAESTELNQHKHLALSFMKGLEQKANKTE